MNAASGVAGRRTPSEFENTAHWVDGGPLHDWAVVHSRLAHPLAAGIPQARFMFTKVNPAAPVPVIQGWVDHLKALGVSDAPESGSLFWRLVVRQRSFAMNAQPFHDVAEALESARQMTRRAARLTVSFGFFPGEPIPKWVVLDEGAAAFVGLPQHHLVRVNDPRASLAPLLSNAQVKTKVHEVVSGF